MIHYQSWIFCVPKWSDPRPGELGLLKDWKNAVTKFKQFDSDSIFVYGVEGKINWLMGKINHILTMVIRLRFLVLLPYSGWDE